MKAAITILFLAVALVGCGGGDDETKDLTKAVESAAEEWPNCSDIWVVGETLPEDYEGCIGKSGDLVPPVVYDCKDGSKLTYVDEPAAFARLGTKVQPGDNQTEEFSAEFDKCDPA